MFEAIWKWMGKKLLAKGLAGAARAEARESQAAMNLSTQITNIGRAGETIPRQLLTMHAARVANAADAMIGAQKSIRNSTVIRVFGLKTPEIESAIRSAPGVAATQDALAAKNQLTWGQWGMKWGMRGAIAGSLAGGVPLVTKFSEQVSDDINRATPWYVPPVPAIAVRAGLVPIAMSQPNILLRAIPMVVGAQSPTIERNLEQGGYLDTLPDAVRKELHQFGEIDDTKLTNQILLGGAPFAATKAIAALPTVMRYAVPIAGAFSPEIAAFGMKNGLGDELPGGPTGEVAQALNNLSHIGWTGKDAVSRIELTVGPLALMNSGPLLRYGLPIAGYFSPEITKYGLDHGLGEQLPGGPTGEVAQKLTKYSTLKFTGQDGLYRIEAALGPVALMRAGPLLRYGGPIAGFMSPEITHYALDAGIADQLPGGQAGPLVAKLTEFSHTGWDKHGLLVRTEVAALPVIATKAAPMLRFAAPVAGFFSPEILHAALDNGLGDQLPSGDSGPLAQALHDFADTTGWDGHGILKRSEAATAAMAAPIMLRHPVVTTLGVAAIGGVYYNKGLGPRNPKYMDIGGRFDASKDFESAFGAVKDFIKGPVGGFIGSLMPSDEAHPAPAQPAAPTTPQTGPRAGTPPGGGATATPPRPAPPLAPTANPFAPPNPGH